jgi:predicted RNase H-like nuclease
VLPARSWEEACQIRFRLEHKRMSRQAWGIVGKVREVDEILLRDRRLLDRVVEVHPELTFLEWAGRPVPFGKKTRAGRAQRGALIDSLWPGQLERCRGCLRGAHYAVDDLHDAFAALWTSRRIAAGLARQIPLELQRDPKGLPMRIVV